MVAVTTLRSKSKSPCSYERNGRYGGLRSPRRRTSRRNAAALNGKSGATFRTYGSFVEAAVKFLQGFRQIGAHPPTRRYVVPPPAAMNDHHRQCARRTGETVQRALLTNAPGFAQQPLEAVPRRGVRMATGRKSDLHGRVGFEARARRYPVHDPNAPLPHRAHVFAGAIEQGSNKALPLETERAGQFLKRARASILRHDGDLKDYLPDRVSLTVRTRRPFPRRRRSTRRPFFELMRARKPCLFARLRRLG